MSRIARAALAVVAAVQLGLIDAAWSIQTSNPQNAMVAGTVAAPSGVVATLISSRTIELTWTAPAPDRQGTGTRIDRNVNGGAFSTLATVTPGSATLYDDAPVSTARHPAYCYVLTTVAGSWTAGPTAPVCVTA